MSEAVRPRLSVVVACFEMARELPRTLHSLGAEYQRGVEEADYELVLVDNGSRVPPVLGDFPGLRARLRVLSNPTSSKSPVGALARGLAEASGELVGVIIDGARMASPGLLAGAMAAATLHPRAIVFTQSLTLGHGFQAELARGSYDQAAEDRLLDSIDWPRDGYRLFEIATWPNRARGPRRWVEPFYESNALFMPRALWDEVGGYDQGFQSPGGGMASVDLLARAAELPGTQLVVLTGEATFHQIHSLSASSASHHVEAAVKGSAREYHRLRKRPPRPVARPFRTLGIAPDREPPEVPGPTVPGLGDRYLDLLRGALLNDHYLELEAAGLAAGPAGGGAVPAGSRRAVLRVAATREQGMPPAAGRVPAAYTMIGRRRLDDLQRCAETALADGVAGDFIECGVWRGGACILLAGVLEAQGAKDRCVWVADSFAGMPAPRPGVDEDLGMTPEEARDLAVDLETVRGNFARFGLLSERVRFLPGPFRDSLPGAPIGRLALLRLDGDYRSSTLDVLEHLYPKVSPGGFVLVDDAGAVPQCDRAVAEYREAHGITEPLRRIDWTCVGWRKA